jgi:hypothetical protein
LGRRRETRRIMAKFEPMVMWSEDEEFEYPNNRHTGGKNPLIVYWNMYGDEIGITLVEWDDEEGHRHYTGDELYDMDIDLAEEIIGYIETEFLESEDFWLTKMGYDF